MNDYSYNVTQNLLPSRLDKILADISGFSRSKIQQMIKAGTILVGGLQVTDTSYKIITECEIKITEYTPPVPDHVAAKEMDLDIVYEDDHIMVINKPAGLTVHPGAGNYDDTLVNGLLFRCKDNLSQVNGDERPGIVHRLDRDTTGLMMVAKSDIAHHNLAEQIQEKVAQRKYLALCWGMVKQNAGTINANIGRNSRDRTKKAVLEVGGKNAATHYKVLEILASGLFSLVECELETGRTHQIRVHMSHIGHSIVGDQTYGTNDRKIRQLQNQEMKQILLDFHRQALHAYKLSFTHPLTNELMKFELSPPEDMQNLLDGLR